MKKITLVIPVYNEGENVNRIYESICASVESGLNAYELEILYSDNASNDDSYERIKELAQKDPRVKGIQLSRNFGYQANILTGYMNATGDAVVQLDADGEDPPDAVIELVKGWEEGYDVVYGVRVSRQESKWMQFQRAVFYKILNRMAALSLPAGAGDFRLLDRKVVDVLCTKFTERNPYVRGLTSYIGFKQKGVPYHRGKREAGRSKFNYAGYIRLAWDAIASFSRVPLTFVSVTGIIMAFLSIIGGIFYLGLYVIGNIPVQGFTTLVLIILFISGIQMLSLGILGEYIARVFDEVKSRPRSIVAESCGFDKEPESA